MGMSVSLSLRSTGTRKQALIHGKCHQRPTVLRRGDRDDTSSYQTWTRQSQQ